MDQAKIQRYGIILTVVRCGYVLGYERLQLGGRYYIKVKNHLERLTPLIWEAFNGKVPNGLEIDHIDQNSLNDRLDNLRLLPHELNCCNRRNNVKVTKLPIDAKQLTTVKKHGQYNTVQELQFNYPVFYSQREHKLYKRIADNEFAEFSYNGNAKSFKITTNKGMKRIHEQDIIDSLKPLESAITRQNQFCPIKIYHL